MYEWGPHNATCCGLSYSGYCKHVGKPLLVIITSPFAIFPCVYILLHKTDNSPVLEQLKSFEQTKLKMYDFYCFSDMVACYHFHLIFVLTKFRTKIKWIMCFLICTMA